jgi:hypothetical protein
VAVAAAGLMALAAGTARAGPIASDENGMDGWKGTVLFSNVEPEYYPALAVDVDYCVYEPGDFTLSYPGETVDSGHYVYAYQLWNDLDPHPGWEPQRDNEDYVQQFTVGMNDQDEQATNVGYVSGTGQAPSSSNLNITTALWWYVGSNRLYYPSNSAVLYYTSPFSPEWDSSTVQGYNLCEKDDSLPSPTPEPATLTVLVAGGLAIVLRKGKAPRRRDQVA